MLASCLSTVPVVLAPVKARSGSTVMPRVSRQVPPPMSITSPGRLALIASCSRPASDGASRQLTLTE